jgi:hypothetical protein
MFSFDASMSPAERCLTLSEMSLRSRVTQGNPTTIDIGPLFSVLVRG